MTEVVHYDTSVTPNVRESPGTNIPQAVTS